MSKFLTVFLTLAALVFVFVKPASAATNVISCYRPGFYLNDPANTPGNYYLRNQITSAFPGQTIVVAANWSNVGTNILYQVRQTLNLYGAPWGFKDADHTCTLNPTTKLLACTFGIGYPGTGSSSAERIRIATTAIPGKTLTLSAVAKAGSDNSIVSYCPLVKLNIVPKLCGSTGC